MATIPNIQLIATKDGTGSGGRVIFASPYVSRDIYFKDFALVEEPLRKLGLTGAMPDSYDALNRLESFTDIDLDHFNEVIDRYEHGDDRYT